MTINYSHQVTKTSRVGNFLRLLARWKGSIYKIVWTDLIIYLIIYYSINFIYYFCLGEHGKKHFTHTVGYFSKYSNLVPLSFVLGFYVNVVYTRWWNQYTAIPYPDNIAILVGAAIHGKGDKPRMIRRTIIRYVCVAFTMTLRMMSPKAKKRFPTLEHFVHAGLLTREEKSLIEELDDEYPTYPKYWLPLAWASNVTTRARAEGAIQHELGLKDILQEINDFREKCKKLLDFDWICVPLVYTQVVTLAIYIYFLCKVIGSQVLEHNNSEVGIFFYFPLMSLVEFFFYMGWLKVAESLINPFGEDDDDFEVVWMIDRHLQVGYLLVDKIHDEHPVLTKDMYWNVVAPQQLPFTVASQKYMFEQPVESTSAMQLHKNDQDLIIAENFKEYKPVHHRGLNKLQRLFNRKKKHESVHLKKVSIDDHSDYVWDEFNIYEGEPISIENENQIPLSHPEEFLTLRKERLNKRKEDLLRCLDLLRDNKEKAKEILEDIIEEKEKELLKNDNQTSDDNQIT